MNVIEHQKVQEKDHPCSFEQLLDRRWSSYERNSKHSERSISLNQQDEHVSQIIST